MISVPCGTGGIPCGYDICFADDIRFAYAGTDIISYMQSKYIIQRKLYIISRQRYIIAMLSCRFKSASEFYNGIFFQRNKSLWDL